MTPPPKEACNAVILMRILSRSDGNSQVDVEEQHRLLYARALAEKPPLYTENCPACRL